MKKFLLLLSFGLFYSAASRAQTSFAPLAEELMPSVVNISTRQENTADSPEIVNDLLFAAPDGRVALGSGFIISEDGYIATNRHVIEKASEITVVTADNQTYEAELIGADEKTDLALIKIAPQKSLHPVELGDSDAVRVGDWVLAIGNPFGLGSSVSVGIISAKSRAISGDSYADYLQTDASINQGNSGGPMFDMDGQVIGINTAIFSTVGNSVGVGFALPVNQIRWELEQLRTKGKVSRQWLGILVKQAKTDGVSGLTITALENEALALQNNLQIGDVIMQLNGTPVSTAQDFANKVAQIPTGNTLSLIVWRNGEVLDIQATPEPMPEKAPLSEKAETPQNSEAEKEGVYYPQLGLRMDGLWVLDVDENSDAFAKGIAAGDKIIKANNIPVSLPVDLQRQAEDSTLSGAPLRLDIEDSLSADTFFVDLNLAPNVPFVELAE